MILKEEQTGTLAHVGMGQMWQLSPSKDTPYGAGSPQHSWPPSLLLEQRDRRGQWLPAPRGPALLTEVTSAVSVVPAWAVVVLSLLTGVPPSTCQSKGNQMSLEVPPEWGTLAGTVWPYPCCQRKPGRL